MNNLLNKISEIAAAHNQGVQPDGMGEAAASTPSEGAVEGATTGKADGEKAVNEGGGESAQQPEASNPEGQEAGQTVEDTVNVSLNVLKGYEEKAKMLEDVIDYVERLSDPKIYYESEKDYLKYQIKRENNLVPYEVIDRAVEGVEGMDTLTALRYGMLMENPDIEGGMEGVDELLMERYGVDDLSDDLPRSVKNRMAIDAKEAKAKMAKLVDGRAANRPKVVDEILQNVEQARHKYNEAVTAWKETQLEYPTAIRIGEDFEFRFEQAYLDRVKEVLPEYMASKGLSPADEGAMDIVNSEVKTAYIADNFERIAEAYAKYRVSKAIEQIKAEYAGMVEQPKDNSAPADSMNDVLISLKQKAIKAGLIRKT